MAGVRKELIAKSRNRLILKLKKIIMAHYIIELNGKVIKDFKHFSNAIKYYNKLYKYYDKKKNIIRLYNTCPYMLMREY